MTWRDFKNRTCHQASYLKLKAGCREIHCYIDLQAFLSRRVVTPQGIRPAAVIVDGEVIREVVTPDQIPSEAKILDFGDAAILPGLIDAHVHINDPGRAEWGG